MPVEFQHEPKGPPRKACVLCGKEYSGKLEICPDDGTLLTPIGKEPKVGDVFADRYEILGIIGDGGMGKVYKARHNLMKRTVAIKLLLPHLVQSGSALKRFQQEAQAASALKHPHIMTVHDFGISETGMPFLVMDYLEGVSLSTLLQEQGFLPQERAVNIFIQACSAFSHAHKNKVLHRDLKPANLMIIDFDGQPDFLMVVDFGIAKLLEPDSASEQLTHTGEIFGSPLYMSPEQCRGKELDARSDIYSLGCVIYRTVTGHPVFGGRNAMECMYKQVNDLPGSFSDVCPELGLSDKLEAAVFKAVAKNPDDRFQTMAEFSQALALVKGDPQSPAYLPLRNAPSQNESESTTNQLGRITTPPASEPTTPPPPAAETATTPLDQVIEYISVKDPPEETGARHTISAKTNPPAIKQNKTRTTSPQERQALQLKQFLPGAAIVLALLIGSALVTMCLQHKSSPGSAPAGSGSSKENASQTGTQVSEARTLIATGNYQTAEKTLNKAIVSVADERELAQVLPLQAGVYEQSGKYRHAQDCWSRLLAIQEKSAAGPIVIAQTKAHLAMPLIDLGKIDEAEPLLNAAQKVLAVTVGQDKGLSQVYWGLSKVALKRGDYNQAAETLKKAIALRTKAGGEGEPELLQFWQDLSEVYLVQGKLVDAQAALETMLKLDVKDPQKRNSPRIADAYKDLGALYFQKGQLSRAESFLKKSLVIKNADFGADSVPAAEVMATLAMLYTREKKYRLAEPLFKQALEIRTRELGADSPQAKRTRDNYDTCQKLRQGRH